jgi:hypothetical protein
LICSNTSNSLHAVLLAELFHPTGGVDDLLLAGIERVALRTYFNVQCLATGGSGLKLVAAAAGYGDLVVIRMNVGFHSDVLKFWYLSQEGGDYARNRLNNQPLQNDYRCAGSATSHGIKKFSVVFGGFDLVQQEFHCLEIVHRVEQFA